MFTSKVESAAQKIETDYVPHPSEVDRGREINPKYAMKELRNAIPLHCFRLTSLTSLFYLFRDFVVAGSMMYAAYNYVPIINNVAGRYFFWAAYGYFQGQQMTGIWVLGHECGHGVFLSTPLLNDAIGWTLHSALLTPYFSWQSTHRRHHVWNKNMSKDHDYVPPTAGKYAELVGVDVTKLDELTEDAPIITFGRILVQQIFGWPWYLLTNITATQGSLASHRADHRPARYPLGNSHFSPTSSLFRPDETHLILASDLGIGLMLCGAMPYAWVNHWIVAVTYLHHSHPEVPKYEPEAWTFLKGATATIDRGLGFGGKHFMHNIADFHVIHHLFPSIPQYHAEEATRAIQPLLGESYHEDKERNFWACIYESFAKCQYVMPSDANARPADRVMLFKGGPSPPIELSMGRGGLMYTT